MVMMVITPTIFTVWVMPWLPVSQNTLVFLAYLQGDWHPAIALSCCKIAEVVMTVLKFSDMLWKAHWEVSMCFLKRQTSSQKTKCRIQKRA